MPDDTRRIRGFGDTNFVMVSQEPADAGSARVLPEVRLDFETRAEIDAPWSVRGVWLREGLSSVYECVLDLANADLGQSPDMLLGRPAQLRIVREHVVRRVHGVVRRVEHHGNHAGGRLARAVLVPSLWALAQRTDARVFQDLTAVEVVQAVLRDAGLYAGMVDLQLARTYPAREYRVQYRETDLAFVERVLADEGIAYFFRHDEDDGETLVLADGLQAYGRLATMDGAAVPIAGPEGATSRVETVRHLVWERELRPTDVVVREFDFTRPDLRVERRAPRGAAGARSQYEPTPALALGRYAAGAYASDDAAEQAQLRHEAAQLRGAVGAGEGNVTGMIPGAVFQLGLEGAPALAQRYVVTRVEHTARAPEVLLGVDPGAQAAADRYANRFECVPVEVPFRPSRELPRPVIAGLQTATVTGPSGEEVYCDPHGRIRVQFHWDRVGARDEHSACWVRVLQGPWAGDGWGMQFVPRVGMEVAVSFVEGDPDRPIVVGAVYNGRNAGPFGLPDDRSRSGFRTRSIGGGGHNELSFEDAAGMEQVYLRAQRDHDEVTVRDHTHAVGADERLTVGGRRDDHVRGDEARAVDGERRTTVGRDDVQHVRESRVERVDGGRRTRIGGDDARAVVGRATLDAGNVDERVAKARTTRVGDLELNLVGSHEQPGNAIRVVEGFAAHIGRSGMVVLPQGLTLVVGETMVHVSDRGITVSAKRIDLHAGESSHTLDGRDIRTTATGTVTTRADTVKMASSGASIALQGDARIDGSSVRLKSDTSIPDEHQSAAQPTSLELTDPDGRPLANRPYVIRTPHGHERAGVLDADGKATVLLETDATVRFPGLVDLQAQ